MLDNHELVYLDYTEDKQYTLRAKKDITIYTKVLKELPLIFIPMEMKNI